MLSREQFNSILKHQGTLIIDGALATELETRGYDLNHPLWSAKILDEDPMVIKQVHLDYFIAGANIAITASYQASAQGFARHLGLEDTKATSLIKRSAMLARLAVEEAYGQGVRRNTPLLVAGSIGPYGAFLADGSEYRGDYELTKSEFQDFHRGRIQALIDADVDLLAIETMPQFAEIEAVLDLIRDEFPAACVWLSCTLKDADHISDGTSVKDVCRLVNSSRDNIVAFGFNCVPADLATKALQGINGMMGVPSLVYPNSGETWNAQTKTWSHTESEPSGFSRYIPSWQDAGAKLIGGCCRSTPTDIIALTRSIKG